MKAYLIDPDERSITEVEYNGDFREISHRIEAEAFDSARFNEHGDSVFIDDMGLLRDPVPPLFMVFGYPQPLAGKGLVLGTDEMTGESTSPRIGIEELRNRIHWGSWKGAMNRQPYYHGVRVLFTMTRPISKGEFHEMLEQALAARFGNDFILGELDIEEFDDPEPGDPSDLM